MQRIITGFEPDSIFKYFEDISAIPRASGNEAGVADYLCRFAEERSLECVRDANHNVIIKKPATALLTISPLILLLGLGL